MGHVAAPPKLRNRKKNATASPLLEKITSWAQDTRKKLCSLKLAFRVFAPSHEAPQHDEITTGSPFKAFNDGAYFRCEN
jgi:hypothetical protein